MNAENEKKIRAPQNVVLSQNIKNIMTRLRQIQDVFKKSGDPQNQKKWNKHVGNSMENSSKSIKRRKRPKTVPTNVDTICIKKSRIPQNRRMLPLPRREYPMSMKMRRGIFENVNKRFFT